MGVSLLALVPGAALVLIVAWDIMLTLLHPTARGPLSYAANRATWSAARAVSIRLLGGRGLSYAGPLAVVMNVYAWVLTLWLGYALIYLPFVDSLAYDPAASFEGKGFPEALYLSGAALTTAGFGDVAANDDILRLVTTVEAASGFGVLSAAIAFVLSLYPLISHLRSTSIQLADAGGLDLHGAARIVREGGPSELSGIIRGLTQNHEHLRRFPVLYYFESGNREESLSAIVRSSSLLLAAMHADAKAEGGHPSMYADALGHIIVRLLDDLERDFVHGRRRPVGDPRDRQGDADARLTALFGTLDPNGGHDRGTEPERVELAAVLVRAERVLEAVAKEHGHQARPLLPELSSDAGEGDVTATGSRSARPPAP